MPRLNPTKKVQQDVASLFNYLQWITANNLSAQVADVKKKQGDWILKVEKFLKEDLEKLDDKVYVARWLDYEEETIQKRLAQVREVIDFVDLKIQENVVNRQQGQPPIVIPDSLRKRYPHLKVVAVRLHIALEVVQKGRQILQQECNYRPKEELYKEQVANRLWYQRGSSVMVINGLLATLSILLTPFLLLPILPIAYLWKKTRDQEEIQENTLTSEELVQVKTARQAYKKLHDPVNVAVGGYFKAERRAEEKEADAVAAPEPHVTIHKLKRDQFFYEYGSQEASTPEELRALQINAQKSQQNKRGADRELRCELGIAPK